jgi:hypothetical protein
MFQPTNRLNRLAVAGAIAVGMAIAVSSLRIVRAEYAKPSGSVIYSCSSGTACVEGDSSGGKTWGVYGVSATADGAHGVTSSSNGNSGVSGISTGTSGMAHGVYGRSSNGQGVYGTSSSSNGVEGHTTSIQNFAGVAGYGSDVTNGVYGDGSTGVFGESSNGGESLYAVADDTKTNIFYGIDDATDDTCIINSKANLKCSGSITGGKALRVKHANAGGQQVLAYGSESASATIDDVGTGRMVAGVANVPFNRDFAYVIDRNSQYYVFLTPLGDTRGLYVSMKTATGFQVRETERGRSTLSFDYRIVARPLDAKDDRLPLAPAVKTPPRRHATQ